MRVTNYTTAHTKPTPASLHVQVALSSEQLITYLILLAATTLIVFIVSCSYPLQKLIDNQYRYQADPIHITRPCQHNDFDNAIPPPSRQDPSCNQEIIKINTNLVTLDIQVMDLQNRLINTSFRKEDFTIFEDGVKQEVIGIDREDMPVSLGIMIDTSGSMVSVLKSVCAGALDLIQRLRGDDEAFVAQFKEEPELLEGYTSDKRTLEEVLSTVYASGDNALLTALLTGIEYTSSESNGNTRRRALVVYTDGQDSNSRISANDVINALNRAKVNLYIVGILGKNPYDKTSTKVLKEFLSRLARVLGGRAFYPKNDTEIVNRNTEILTDLRNRYVLSYYPINNGLDGTFRRVRVEVDGKNRNKLIVRTRQGYYAAKKM